MNLIIDIGNTNIKLAVFNGENIVYKEVTKASRLLSTVRKILKKYPSLNKAILSSVGKLKEGLLIKIQSQINLLVLDSSVKLPFTNQYETPKTLGVDRIALVSASAIKYPNKNVLIIDAGTCITYDFINHKNTYLGGAISPGIRLRYQCLHNLTANLPLLNIEQPKNIIGVNTQESIHSGVINGVLNEIRGSIQEYEQEFKELTVILTGGDAEFLSKQLKSSIFANSNFLLEGLNYILEYNLGK
jgi:type III pantothenate kinase